MNVTSPLFSQCGLASIALLSRLTKRTARLALLVLAGILCISFPSYAANQIFQQTYPLPAGGTFLLANVNGSVQVDGWDRNEVEVRAVKTAPAGTGDLNLVQIEVESHPGEIAVRTRYPKDEGVAVAVDYHVYVPYRVLLGSIETVNGSVFVRGVEGEGDLRSVNGNVEVLDSAGRFSAKTTNGNLRLELCKLFDGAPMHVETVNGSVILGLPSDAHANLKVLNMNGNFYSELPVTTPASLHVANAFRAKLGPGGSEISVRTINGGIRLVRERPGI